MTIIELPAPGAAVDLNEVPVDSYDFYRQIHKGIRHALFHTTQRAGSLDVADAAAVDSFVDGHRSLLELLDLHHHHEDAFVQPLLENHAPELARTIATEHGDIEAGMARLAQRCGHLATAGKPARSGAALNLYLDLGRMTGLYLAHQLVEETQVMPTLRAALPEEELVAVDLAIRSTLPPDAMAAVMTYMLPALDVEERTEMLGGMAMAPPDVFAVFCAAAQSALSVDDWAELSRRIGIPS